METSGSNFIITVAIDFGTTYSGYAYQYKHQFKANKLTVSTPTFSDGRISQTLKTPTKILLSEKNDQLVFEEFGFKAENRYIQLQRDNMHHNYHYIQFFKMALYSTSKISSTSTICDIVGREVSALEVFTLSIKLLKDEFLSTMKKGNNLLKDGDIKWLLTVPAIWDEDGKQFMRTAAQKAGISTNQLGIVLEPEAASLYCRILPMDRRTDKTDVDLQAIPPGNKFMVLDCGGGTVDITVHEVASQKQLVEIHRASGGPWGGSYVNANFNKLLGEVFGKEIMDKLKLEYPKSYLELQREFEISKPFYTGDDFSDTESYRIPYRLVELFSKTYKRDIEDVLGANSSKYNGKIEVYDGEIRIRSDVLFECFNQVITKIEQQVAEIIGTIKENSGNLDYIFMVGGFSQCCLLQKRLIKKFSTLKVIIPDEPVLAVVKGAVIYGQDPNVISKRIARHTYGFGTTESFDPKIHPKEKAFIDADGVLGCRDVFGVLFRRNDELITGQETDSISVSPLTRKQTGIAFKVYRTFQMDPRYTDHEGCKYLGSLIVTGIPEEGEGNREVLVSVTAADTELKVSAFCKHTKRKVDACFDFMSK